MNTLLLALENKPRSDANDVLMGLIGLGILALIAWALYRAGRTRGELEARKDRDRLPPQR